MKIYFSGSISGGRGDQALYMEIITLLKTYGEVLTEFIGDGTLTHMGITTLTPVEIYTKDTNWLKECDVVVAEITTPSLGVGYEIAYAEALGKKVIGIYRELPDKRISAMITGNEYVQCFAYTDVKELPEIFDRVLK